MPAERSSQRPAHDDRPLRLLCLGDSYTIGEGVDPAERWPAVLEHWLRVRGHPVQPPTVIAKTGWSTTELSDAIDAASPEPPFDLVTLLIGVNDQYRDWPESEFPDRLAALVDRAIGLAGGRPRRCLAISIPDWGVTPFGQRDRRGPAAIGQAIDRYNRMVAAVAATRGVRFVDITPLSRAPEWAAATTDDGLHPAAECYRAWVERAIGPAALAALEASRSGEG